MTKKMKTSRRVITMVLAIAILLVASVSASAAGISTFASPGFSSQTIVVSGKNYTCTFSANSTSTQIRTTFSTTANVARAHNQLNAMFNTVNHGYVSGTGGVSVLSPRAGDSHSPYVQCSNKNATVIGIRSFNSSGEVRLTTYGSRIANFMIAA